MSLLRWAWNSFPSYPSFDPAFDPAFYYYRPTSVYAAHGYGPVLLAGAEMINLINSHKFEVNDSAIHALDN